jgi:hypothetical protein
MTDLSKVVFISPAGWWRKVTITLRCRVYYMEYRITDEIHKTTTQQLFCNMQTSKQMRGEKRDGNSTFCYLLFSFFLL